jgi:REP element-mobilizing transposase RayT
MAKKWTNENLPGALHFVTGNVNKRRPIFRSRQFAMAFMDECQKHCREMACKLIAFVVMLDHIHLILNPRNGDIQTSIGILKSLSAKRLVQSAKPGMFLECEDNQVWQESFKSLALWSNWMIWQKINYIHSNPVRKRLVQSAADYEWSSFRSFYQQESDPLLQVDKDWWWPEDVDKLRRAMAERDQKLEDEFNTRRAGKMDDISG